LFDLVIVKNNLIKRLKVKNKKINKNIVEMWR